MNKRTRIAVIITGASWVLLVAALLEGMQVTAASTKLLASCGFLLAAL